MNIGICPEVYLWQHFNKSSALLSQSVHQSCLEFVHLFLLLCCFCALFWVLQGHKLGQGHLVDCPNSFISSICHSLYSWTLHSAEAGSLLSSRNLTSKIGHVPAHQQRLCFLFVDLQEFNELQLCQHLKPAVETRQLRPCLVLCSDMKSKCLLARMHSSDFSSKGKTHAQHERASERGSE